MKKSILIITLFVLSIGFASAEQQGGPGIMGMNGSDEQAGMNAPGEGQRVMAQIGMHIGPQGQQMHLEKVRNRIQLRVGEFHADCDCNLSQEQVQNRTRLYAGLSNGRNAEIKIMPDRASETALQRLRLRNCSGNCSLELKEVGKGEQAKLAYEIKTQKRARFLGLFGTDMPVQAQVNAENGELIRVNKPWWSFLASEEDETEE